VSKQTADGLHVRMFQMLAEKFIDENLHFDQDTVEKLNSYPTYLDMVKQSIIDSNVSAAAKNKRLRKVEQIYNTGQGINKVTNSTGFVKQEFLMKGETLGRLI
jgi:hypothetical protein